MRTHPRAALARLGILAVLAACDNAGAAPGGRGEPVREQTLRRGTAITLRALDSLSSRRNHRGDRLLAASTRDLLDERNEVVVPAGTLFRGTVLAIAPAERPGQQGVLEVEFNAVRLKGTWRPVPLRVIGIDFVMRGRGVTSGDAVKVGAGTVIGGIAGRVIGGDRHGTIIGAAAGTAGGAVYANQTRDIDVVVPRGTSIRVSLTRAVVIENGDIARSDDR
jgi:hypothetical protein